MADFTAQTWSFTSSQSDQYATPAISYPFPAVFQETLTQGAVRRVKMRWLDVDALPTVVYRIWVVPEQPDPTGVFYTGPKTGSTPISGATIEEDYVA